MMKKTISYKGYNAHVEDDPRDKIFFGRIEEIRAIVSFECEHPTEIEEAAQSAIDDYLTDCKERGVEPETPTPAPV